MSLLPSNDPVLGDKRSCDALGLVIVPRVRDLGGFEVRRALPSGTSPLSSSQLWVAFSQLRNVKMDKRTPCAEV